MINRKIEYYFELVYILSEQLNEKKYKYHYE